MILLLNLALPILLLIIAIATVLFAKKSNNRSLTVGKGLIAAFFVTLTYVSVQPSYMPKGKAPTMPRVPIEFEELQVQDRLLKPMAEQERQQRVNELITVRDEVKAVLDKSKD